MPRRALVVQTWSREGLAWPSPHHHLVCVETCARYSTLPLTSGHLAKDGRSVDLDSHDPHEAVRAYPSAPPPSPLNMSVWDRLAADAWESAHPIARLAGTSARTAAPSPRRALQA